MPGEKNRNDLMNFFKKPRSFRRISKSSIEPFAADIFGRQKDIMRVLTSIPESRFFKGENLHSKLSMLCEALNGKRINSHLSATRLKKELKLAMNYRFKELKISRDQIEPLLAEFEWRFDKIYFEDMAKAKPKFSLVCGPLQDVKKAPAIA